MAAGGAGETAAGNLRRARINDVCTCVKRSWDAISEEIIIESFKTCGISNNLDDSDSDLEISDGEEDSVEGENEDDVEDEDEDNINENDSEDENESDVNSENQNDINNKFLK